MCGNPILRVAGALQAKTEVVLDVINELGLAKCADTYIGERALFLRPQTPDRTAA